MVEQDEGIGRMLRLCMAMAGFEVLEAATREEARRLLAEEEPGIVILDLDPREEGAGAAELWRVSADRAPAWIVISALEPGQAAERFALPDAHYLLKPFDPWQLVALLERLVPSPWETPPD